jgi:hypothetical protein
MVGLVLVGLVAAFTVPALNRQMTTWNLRTAHNTLNSEIKLLRQKAISEGRNRRMWFSPGSPYYWTQDPETYYWTMYTLPDRVWFQTSYFTGGYYDTQMKPDGQATRAGTLILRNINNELDTLIVDRSGWVGRP